MQAARNIFLIGPMGSGKSAVGAWLGKQLTLTFVDSDSYIEQKTGVDIARIFGIEGEEGFRAREEQAIQHLCSGQGLVLATGGGAVLRAGNRRALRNNGTVFYLQCSLDEQVKRTRRARNRPLLEQGSRREVLKALKKLSFQMSEEAASSLMVAVQDVLENKVRRGEQRHVCSPSPCSLDKLAVLALVCSLCYVT